MLLNVLGTWACRCHCGFGNEVTSQKRRCAPGCRREIKISEELGTEEHVLPTGHDVSNASCGNTRGFYSILVYS